MLISINFRHFQARIFLPPTSLDTKSTSCWLWRIHDWVQQMQKIKQHMDLSENNGTPKSSILIEFSIINHPFWGTHIFGNIRIISFHVIFHVIKLSTRKSTISPPERSFVRQTVSWWTAFVPGSKRSLEVRSATPENPTESGCVKSLEGFEMSSRWWQGSANRQSSSTIRFVRWPNRLSNSRVLESRASPQGDLWTVIDVKQLGVLDREGSFDCSCLFLHKSATCNSMLQRHTTIINDSLDWDIGVTIPAFSRNPCEATQKQWGQMG